MKGHSPDRTSTLVRSTQYGRHASARLAALIFIAVLSVVMLCACSNAKTTIKEDLTARLDELATCEGTLADAVADALDADTLAEYGIDATTLLPSYLEGFSYSIDGVSVDGDAATVTVTLTCKSYSEALSSFTEQAFAIPSQDGVSDLSDEELYALFEDALVDSMEGASVVTVSSVELGYEKTEDGWEPDDDLASALCDALLAL